VERGEIEIAKMRGINIERARYEYLIDQKYHGVGLVALPTRPGATNVPKDRVITSIAGLDEMLHGELLKTSITRMSPHDKRVVPFEITGTD